MMLLPLSYYFIFFSFDLRIEIKNENLSSFFSFSFLNLLIFSESASDLVEGRYGHTNSKLIYGTFTTPTNSIPGSAVCAFSLQVSFRNGSIQVLFVFNSPRKLKFYFSAQEKKVGYPTGRTDLGRNKNSA